MGMLTMNGGVAISTASSGAESLSVHGEAGMRLNRSLVVVKVSNRMGAVYTVTGFPRS